MYGLGTSLLKLHEVSRGKWPINVSLYCHAYVVPPICPPHNVVYIRYLQHVKRCVFFTTPLMVKTLWTPRCMSSEWTFNNFLSNSIITAVNHLKIFQFLPSWHRLNIEHQSWRLSSVVRYTALLKFNSIFFKDKFVSLYRLLSCIPCLRVTGSHESERANSRWMASYPV